MKAHQIYSVIMLMILVSTSTQYTIDDGCLPHGEATQAPQPVSHATSADLERLWTLHTHTENDMSYNNICTDPTFLAYTDVENKIFYKTESGVGGVGLGGFLLYFYNMMPTNLLGLFKMDEDIVKNKLQKEMPWYTFSDAADNARKYFYQYDENKNIQAFKWTPINTSADLVDITSEVVAMGTKTTIPGTGYEYRVLWMIEKFKPENYYQHFGGPNQLGNKGSENLPKSFEELATKVGKFRTFLCIGAPGKKRQSTAKGEFDIYKDVLGLLKNNVDSDAQKQEDLTNNLNNRVGFEDANGTTVSEENKRTVLNKENVINSFSTWALTRIQTAYFLIGIKCPPISHAPVPPEQQKCLWAMKLNKLFTNADIQHKRITTKNSTAADRSVRECVMRIAGKQSSVLRCFLGYDQGTFEEQVNSNSKDQWVVTKLEDFEDKKSPMEELFHRAMEYSFSEKDEHEKGCIFWKFKNNSTPLSSPFNQPTRIFGEMGTAFNYDEANCRCYERYTLDTDDPWQVDTHNEDGADEYKQIGGICKALDKTKDKMNCLKRSNTWDGIDNNWESSHAWGLNGQNLKEDTHCEICKGAKPVDKTTGQFQFPTYVIKNDTQNIHSDGNANETSLVGQCGPAGVTSEFSTQCQYHFLQKVKDEITQQSDLASVVAEPKCMVCADGMFPHQTDDYTCWDKKLVLDPTIPSSTIDITNIEYALKCTCPKVPANGVNGIQDIAESEYWVDGLDAECAGATCIDGIKGECLEKNDDNFPNSDILPELTCSPQPIHMCKSYYARSSTNALLSQSTKYYECFECDDGFSVKNSSTYATHINQCVKVPRTTVAGYNYDTQCRVVYQNYTWDVETELSGKDGKATIPQDPVCAECTPHHFYATPDRQGCVDNRTFIFKTKFMQSRSQKVVSTHPEGDVDTTNTVSDVSMPATSQTQANPWGHK